MAYSNAQLKIIAGEIFEIEELWIKIHEIESETDEYEDCGDYGMLAVNPIYSDGEKTIEECIEEREQCIKEFKQKYKKEYFEIRDKYF